MAVVVGVCVAGCSSQKDLNGALTSNSSHAAFNGTAAKYYQIDTVLTNVNYSNLLVGNWSVQSIRQARRNRFSKLAGAVLSLQADENFQLIMGCDTLTGQFAINQNRITFNNIVPTPASCSNREMDNLMTNLLHVDASFYQVSNSSLLLKDGYGTGLLLASKIR